MKQIRLGSSEFMVPPIAVGCMRINSLGEAEAERFVEKALELGANFFDHSDVYGMGRCEEIFAKAVHMTPSVREKLILQSKCGILKNPARYDFSKKHILEAVDGILSRLETEYLDILLLHRPDALMEPEEVAEAFDILHSTGKVRHFGVSNQNPMQMQLLQKYLHQKILVNQLQFSIMHPYMASAGINVNMVNDSAVNRDGSVLDYCRLNDITIQAWSPFQYGFFEGVFIGNEKFPELNKKLDEIAEKYGVTSTTIAVAWILRHPAHMQAISGTMKPGRLEEICKAADITLTREEWYEIYTAAGNVIP
ncbi:aldo/keto reductase [Anaerolentibacter hominis]|uniref:aldo/keto reductase n=1 Tax=Anaerolentibacter hominis TaxID=3079009 RepID=UPI0031B8043E